MQTPEAPAKKWPHVIRRDGKFLKCRIKQHMGHRVLIELETGCEAIAYRSELEQLGCK